MKSLCPTVEVSLCWEQHSLFPHTPTLQRLLTLILGKRSHSFHQFKAMELFPAKHRTRLTERWHFSASGGGRSTGFGVIDVRALCSLHRCQWHINMKLCESFFPFRLECVRVTASCVPPDRRSEDFALRHRVHSLTLSSILRQFVLSPAPRH